MTRTTFAALVALVGALSVMLGVSGAADAAASMPALLASSPAHMSTVGTVDSVTLQFDIAVDPREVTIELSGPADISVQAPAGGLTDSVEIPLGAALAEGAWELTWSAAGADGVVAFAVEPSANAVQVDTPAGVPGVPDVGEGPLPAADATPESVQTVKLPVVQLVFMGVVPVVASLVFVVVAGRRRRALVREAQMGSTNRLS